MSLEEFLRNRSKGSQDVHIITGETTIRELNKALSTEANKRIKANAIKFKKEKKVNWEEVPIDFTPEQLTACLMKIFSETGERIFTDWDQPIDQLYPGSGAYRLPGGGLTGIGGWEHFTKLFKETNAN